MNEVEKLEAQIAALNERKATLDARLRQARQKADAEDRKGRAQANTFVGKAVIDVLGDWKALDPAALVSWLEEHADGARAACVGEALDVKDALPRFRNPKAVGGRSSASRKEARDEAPSSATPGQEAN